MDWTTPLRAQQTDFIKKLKSGFLLHCEKEGLHSELTVISGEKLKHLRDFSREMAEKYRTTLSCLLDDVNNNFKGKLGEEIVKAHLGNLVNPVNYEIINNRGDGKFDFKLTFASPVRIQVKARHKSIDTIDTVEWSISQEEIEENVALVCIWIPEYVSVSQSEYKLVMAGFLPTNLIKESGKYTFKIDELLYGGGLKSFLCQQGVETATQAINHNPNNPAGYLCRASFYLILQKSKTAVDDLHKVVNLWSQQPGNQDSAQKMLDFIKEIDSSLSS